MSKKYSFSTSYVYKMGFVCAIGGVVTFLIHYIWFMIFLLLLAGASIYCAKEEKEELK